MFQDLAEIIRAIRKRRRENQAEFGARIGADQSTVSQYETGRIEPSPAVLLHLQRLAETDEEKRTIAVLLPGNHDLDVPSDNLIAQIRQAARLSVPDFAAALHVSQIDVAAFETGREIPEPPVVRRLQEIATKARRADLALILTSDEWKVRAVFHPGETFISMGRQQPNSPDVIVVSDEEKVHVEKLLRVLRSPHPKPRQAVIENLDTFYDFCELADYHAARRPATGRGAGAGEAPASHSQLAGDLPGNREKSRAARPQRVRPRKRA